MEKIVCAALKVYTEDGEFIIAGVRHFDQNMSNILESMEAEQIEKIEQGFLSNKGFYFNRKEALQIAKNAKQLIRKTEPVHLLFSEDLY